ncbi:hypothetical protein [Noviherbaspirillum sp. ST9]|uniref:hypothetical protein n=1 Tax=Noviherbaspirillum sp. ST9 TaxID=3401606 RepID=UPI003B58A702
MDTEVVLFLRDEVADAALQEALAEAFGVAPDTADKPLVVRYVQGFAIGVSLPCEEGLHAEKAAALLSTRLDTAVLLESCAGTQWILFAPGERGPLDVQVVELRHGLDVLMPLVVTAASPGAIHA